MLERTSRSEDEELSVGELVQQLADDGKAYARAEFTLARTIAEAKAKALVVPAVFLGAALLVAQAAVVMLALALFSAIFTSVGPVAAALVTAVVLAAIGWLLVAEAKKRLGMGK